MTEQEARSLSMALVRTVEVVTTWHGIPTGLDSASDADDSIGPREWPGYLTRKILWCWRNPEKAEYDPLRMTLVVFSEQGR